MTNLKTFLYCAVPVLALAAFIFTRPTAEPVPTVLKDTPTPASAEPSRSSGLQPLENRASGEPEGVISARELEVVRSIASQWSDPESVFNPVRHADRDDWFENFDALGAGERVYTNRWDEYVEGLELSGADRREVRETLVAYEARKMELRHLAGIGEISWDEAYAEIPSTEEVIRSLNMLLTSAEINGLLEHDRVATERAMRQLEQSTANSVANGIVGIVNAALVDDLSTVKAYIASGADVNRMTVDGSMTPLTLAAENGNLEMARALIEAGADVNLATAKYGSSPLDSAAYAGHTELVREFVAAGADLEYYDGSPRNTALYAAAESGYTETVAELLALGADATGEAGIYALSAAIEYGDRDMEQMLIDAGADADARYVQLSRKMRAAGEKLGYITD